MARPTTIPVVAPFQTISNLLSCSLSGLASSLLRRVTSMKSSCSSFFSSTSTSSNRLVFRPGVFAGRLREHRLGDLELRNVHRRIHVQENCGIAQHLLDAEVEHHAVAAV